MRKNKPSGFTLIITLFILFNSACAQTPTGEAYVAEEAKVQSSTYLFNNQKELIPLKKLAEKKIASIHFSHTNAAGFDSLLNNYAKVAVFNGANYLGAKSTEELSRDVKMFNTLIVQLTENDLNNTRITDFIKANHKLKDIIIAYFGKGAQLGYLTDFKGPLFCSEQVSPVASFFVAQAVFGGVA